MSGRQAQGRGRVRPGYWFRPKLYGLGATPATWQGWVLTAALAAIAIAVARLAEARGAALLVLLVPLIAGFIWLVHAKTDGAWRWRWGPGGGR
ncbi:hypothetical protein ACFQ1E_09610 [Sphingomonas canadensis]|uniref:Uncharacterized protein n=1 Tax=Sphingomonas canadensis TaxID=1219257 RepID=A0ABW3H900_9SPHN|nr:hypothetical protein [Sphingomonas canadensis]MCW3836626.1 hypothetical protein [Sphingomonas canadensis]